MKRLLVSTVTCATALLNAACDDATPSSRRIDNNMPVAPNRVAAVAVLSTLPRVQERVGLDESYQPLFDVPRAEASGITAAPAAPPPSRAATPAAPASVPAAELPFPLVLIGIYEDEGVKRAFFLRGAETVMAKEKDILEGQFRIEAVGKVSVTVRNVSSDQVIDVSY